MRCPALLLCICFLSACSGFRQILAPREPVSGVAAATTTPRTLRDVRLTYMYDPGTELVQGPAGDLYLDRRPPVLHDENRARRAAAPLPFPHQRPRELAPAEPGRTLGVPLGIGADGRAWYAYHDNGTLRLSIVSSKEIAYHEFPEERFTPTRTRREDLPSCTTTLGRCGGDLLLDATGRAWLAGLHAIHHWTGAAWTDLPLPTVEDAQAAADLFNDGGNALYHHQLYRQGDTVWLVRSYVTNCHTPRSAVFRISPRSAALELLTARDEFVTGLIHTGGSTYALIEEGRAVSPDPPRMFTPLRIERLAAGLPRSPQDKEESGPEGAGTARSLGVSAARLLFVSRDGRQFVQPVVRRRPAPRLLMVHGSTVVPIELPHERMTIDHEGQDGAIFAHDGEAIYRLSPGETSFRPVLKIPGNAGKHRVVASRGSEVCLQGPKSHRWAWCRPRVLFWVDLAESQDAPPPPARVISSGLPASGQYPGSYPVAVGPDGTLWFLRYNELATGDLLPPYISAHANAPESVFSVMYVPAEDAPRLELAAVYADALGDAVGHARLNHSIWPFGPEAAIVVAEHFQPDSYNVLLVTRGEQLARRSLHRLLELRHEKMGRLVPDGVIYVADDDTRLVRIGDSFYFEEAIHRIYHNGSGSFDVSGIFRQGKRLAWREEKPGSSARYRPIINRIAGTDPKTGRILGFTDRWQALKWIPLSSDANEEELIDEFEAPWAWRWSNGTDLPRVRSHWILTTMGGGRIIGIKERRREELQAKVGVNVQIDHAIKYESKDFEAFRSWDPESAQWRTIKGSLYGGRVFEDDAGKVWHLRWREAEVFFPNGARQLIPLDAGSPGTCRLAVESPNRVWLATQQSLWAFDLRGQPDNEQWEPAARYSLQAFGGSFAGPWIGGQHLYYTANGMLYQMPLRAGAGSKANPAGS